jgi:protein tyrosine phosphatase
MAHAYYLIRLEGKVYANEELFISAIAGGERALIKMLNTKVVKGRTFLDQALYPLTEIQQAMCEAYSPTVQDFDTTIKHFNILAKDTIQQIQKRKSDAFPKAVIINVKKEFISDFFTYKYITFFRTKDYKDSRKYNMLPKMAAVKICGSVYIAVKAVDVRVESPIIVSVIS